MSNLQLAWLIGLFLVGSLVGLGVAVYKEFYLAEIHDEWDDDVTIEIDPVTGFPKRSDT